MGFIFSLRVFACMLFAVLHVSLWLEELLPGQRCINHGLYRVCGCDSLLPSLTSHVVLQEKDGDLSLVWAWWDFDSGKVIACLKVRTGAL